ncbi:unnamed protein product [Phaeothamnion confervicola]
MPRNGIGSPLAARASHLRPLLRASLSSPRPSSSRQVASCLRTVGDVRPYDTRDPQGRERFHPFTPGHHLSYRIPPRGSKDWYVDYSIGLKEGFDCCSPNSMSFHYVKAELMYRVFNLVYSCPRAL